MKRLILKSAFAILAIFMFINQQLFAQDRATNDEPIVTLVSVLPQGKKEVKISSILSSPMLKVSKAGRVVVGYYASILYQNLTGPEKNEYFGPYKASGAVLPTEITNLLKKYPERNGRIFIENVVVKMEDGVNRNVNPIILSFSK